MGKIKDVLILPFALFILIMITLIGFLGLLFGFNNCIYCGRRVFILFTIDDDLNVWHRKCYRRVMELG